MTSEHNLFLSQILSLLNIIIGKSLVWVNTIVNKVGGDLERVLSPDINVQVLSIGSIDWVFGDKIFGGL